MATTNDGGPVFPTSAAQGSNEGVPGMTLLDYFAGEVICDMLKLLPNDAAANAAYKIAAAMIKARSIT